MRMILYRGKSMDRHNNKPKYIGKKYDKKVGGQAVLGRQSAYATPWLTERHGYDPTYGHCYMNQQEFRN